MSAARNAPLEPLTMPDDLRLESARSQFETLEEVFARVQIDWNDWETVTIHSASNCVRNEIIILEYNMRSALPWWHLPFFKALSSMDLHTVQGLKAIQATSSSNVRAHAGQIENFTVAFSEEEALIDVSVAHRCIVDVPRTLATHPTKSILR